MVPIQVESPRVDAYTYLESCALAVPPLVLAYLYELNALCPDVCRHSLNTAIATAATGNRDHVLEALLHDSAKLAIEGENPADSIRALYPELYREKADNTGLTNEERAIIETHAFLSYEFNKILLNQMPAVDGRTANRAAYVALTHHELPENQTVKRPYSRMHKRQSDKQHVPLVMWIDQFLGPVERRLYKPTMMPVEQVIDRQVAIFADDNKDVYRALAAPIIRSLYLLFTEPIDTDLAVDRMAHAAGITPENRQQLNVHGIIPRITKELWQKEHVQKRYYQQIDHALMVQQL